MEVLNVTATYSRASSVTCALHPNWAPLKMIICMARNKTQDVINKRALTKQYSFYLKTVPRNVIQVANALSRKITKPTSWTKGYIKIYVSLEIAVIHFW